MCLIPDGAIPSDIVVTPEWRHNICIPHKELSCGKWLWIPEEPAAAKGNGSICAHLKGLSHHYVKSLCKAHYTLLYSYSVLHRISIVEFYLGS